MKNMGLGILKRFFSNILHVGKNVIAAGGICPAILETGEKIVAGRGTPIGTYPLGNGLYFDSSSRRLFRKEKAEFVTRQSSTLLLAFLEAENGNCPYRRFAMCYGRMVVVLLDGYIPLSEDFVSFWRRCAQVQSF